ncbi:MAG: thioesterase [Fibrobacter sp.]|nr:thioesterase [Fibrobacter sp.]
MDEKTDKLKSVWSDLYRVHSYEVDAFQRLGIVNLCHYFQESAWNHAEHLGLGFDALGNKGNIWVLVKLKIQMERIPVWNEQIEISTWSKGKKSLYALRDFELSDSSGQCIIKGASEWVIIDAERRRPQRLDSLFDNIPTLSERNCFDERVSTIDSVELADNSHEYSVRYSDLDFNGHVNNAKYLQMALDTFDSNFFREHVPSAIEVNFRSEAEEGQVVEILRKNLGNSDVFSIRKQGESQDLCRISIKWKKINA